jgi:hypothetical protein
VDFFDSFVAEADEDDDRDEQPERRHPDWYGPPQDMMGGVVALGGVVHRSEHLFIGLPMATAYPTGVSFGLDVTLSRGDWSRDEWHETHDLLMGERLHRRSQRAGGTLMIGAELADGRRLSTSSVGAMWRGHGQDKQPEGPLLVEHGRGGSGGGWTYTDSRELWLWPLPDGRSLDLVLAWPALGIPDTRYAVNAVDLRAAATRAISHRPS